MSDFIQRLVEEQTELKEKIIKLEDFMFGENFSKIDPQQQKLLKIQIFCMKGYHEVLMQRLMLLSGTPN